MQLLDVSFDSDGITLAGMLRLPAGAATSGGTSAGGLAAVVLTGPLSGVKEQVTAGYAELLTAAGFVTLCFDHRNFGASGGTPRQHEDAVGKLHDLRDAVTYVSALPEVNPQRIGCCGVCLGGGYALKFSAFDPRIRAMAGVAGGYNSPQMMRSGMGPAGYRDQLGAFAQIAQQQALTGEVVYWSAIDAGGDGPVVMAGQEPFDYYGTERSASPGWENRLTALSVLELITADLAIGADFISPTPLLIVHGRTDEFTSPEQAQAAFDRAGQPKRLVWLDTTNHIDLYDVPEYVEPAAAEVIAWFDRYLRD